MNRTLVTMVAVVMVVVGGGLLLLSAVGVADMMAPPEPYDVADPPSDDETDLEPMIAVNGVCRMDDMAPVTGDGEGRCIVPLVSEEVGDAPIDDYASVPVLYYGPCDTVEEMVGEAFGAEEPAGCQPIGKPWRLEVLSTIEEGVKERYPGFAGHVLEAPDLEEQKEDRMVFIAIVSIALALLIGGVIAFRKSRKLPVPGAGPAANS